MTTATKPLWYELSFGCNPAYTYVVLLVLSLLGPLLMSFDKKVAFYKDWKHLFRPTLLISAIYIVWDIAFTKMGVWQFNKTYLLGTFFSELPIEEYGFFLVVPYASAFVYACLQAYIPNLTSNYNRLFSAGIILISLIAMALAPWRWYTWTTFLLLILSIVYWEFVQKSNNHQYLYMAWIICLIPMSYVNGVLTAKPVLIYNDFENCQIRIGTIPFEDFFYHLLYMVWMINLYQKNKHEWLTRRTNNG